MDCPRCKTAMTTRTRESIEVDFCETCKGIWLDGGELAKVLELERKRTDAEMRENWRLYDRGRDSYDAERQEERKPTTIESLLS